MHYPIIYFSENTKKSIMSGKSWGGDDYNPKSRGQHRDSHYTPKGGGKGRGGKREYRERDDFREENKQKYWDTLRYASDPTEPDYSGKTLLLTTEFLENAVTDVKPRFENMTVEVVNDKTMTVAKAQLDDGVTTQEKMMVLNMASKYKPGGGVKSGSHAQEEHEFGIKTNMMLKLSDALYEHEIQHDWVILQRDITCMKDENLDLLPPDEMFTFPMLACAAVKIHYNDIGKHLTYDKDGYSVYRNNTFRKLMDGKIHNIFMTAYHYGYDTLVLGALGCGAYNNPPKEVTAIFLKYLEKYRNCFKKVVFAIYSRSDDNFDWYQQCVAEPYAKKTEELKGKSKGKGKKKNTIPGL